MRSDVNADRTDEQIRNELTRYLDQLPVEGKEEGWLRIQREVYSSRYNTSRKRLRLPLAAAFILALLLLFRAPAVSAWSRDLLNTMLVKMPGPLRNLVTSFLPTPRNDASRDLDPEDQIRRLLSSVPYRPLIVGDSSQSWKLTGVGVNGSKTGVEVSLQYENREGTVLALREKPVDGARSSAAFYDSDDTAVTEVTIRGISINILTHRTGTVNVWWIEQGLALHLSGESGHDTAVDFISSLTVYVEE